MFELWRKKKTDQVSVPAPRPTPASHLKQSLLSLEQRLMFDAAAAATAAEVKSEQVAQHQADAAVSSEPVADGMTAEQTDAHELLQAIASYTPGETRTEIAFVDPTVPDHEVLLAGMGPNVEVIMLDATRDGMEQIAESLTGRTGIDAIHIISHGSEGQLTLGSGSLTQESMMGQHADEIATIRQALSEQADILVYGCDFAEGQAGQEVATLLSQLTGADVAASTDATGFAALGGDWVLEMQIGTIETQIAVDDGIQANWIGLLAGETPPTITNLSGDSLAYNEGDGAVVIEQSGNALVADVDSTNLDTGTLTVSIPAGDARAEDVLGICNQGTGAGQIGVSGAEVTYQGVTIGTFTGGSSGSNLVITFNASATPTAVTDLVKNITYQDTDTNAPTTGARTVRYVLTDGDGGTSANYDTTVTVSGVNDAPTDLALSANTVAENAPNGTVVGTASTTDPDAGDTHTYQLTDTAGGRFAINASTGQIIVADGSLLDYESAASHNITVQTTDAGGLTHDQSFTITLTNVNEAPTLVGWYNSAWAYRKEITIDHTQVAANQNDFAVLVNLGADADVQAHALANGNDIVFTAADGVTKLNAQIEKYSSVNGELVAWVRVPSLSSVTDTRLFLYYGDPAASNQQNAAGVWDAHTTAVYHLNESGGPYSDSTGNANAGSAIGTPAQTAGEVGMGQVFDGVTTSVTIPNSTANNVADNFTISAWVKLNATGQADVIEKGGNGGYALWLNGTSMWFGKQYATLQGWAKSTTSLTTGVWYKFDGVVSGGIASIYVNGNLENTATSVNSNTNSGALQIGNGIDGHFNGIIDEVRVSDTVRSTSWIATAFKNESAAHTFESFGAQGSDRLIGTNEDTTSSGTVVSEILTNGKWNDVDAGAMQGIAITSQTGNGTWQYSTDGITWSSFGPVAMNNALLLASTSQVRYIPDGINGETATFGYKAWDQTSGTASTNPMASYADPGAGGGATAFSSQSLTEIMAITSVNDAPSTLALSGSTVAENAANGTVVGTASTTDVDAGDLHTYQLMSNAGGRFAIDSNTGVITVTDGMLLDAQVATSHTITIRTTDGGGLTHDHAVTISVTTSNQTPTTTVPGPLLPGTPALPAAAAPPTTGGLGIPGPTEGGAPTLGPVPTPTVLPQDAARFVSPPVAPRITPVSVSPVGPGHLQDGEKPMVLEDERGLVAWTVVEPVLNLLHEAADQLRMLAQSPEMPAKLSEFIVKELDAMTASLEQAMEGQQDEATLVAATAAGVSIVLSTGYVVWALRGGWLLASLLATMPAWRSFDPLPVLVRAKEDRGREGAREDRRAARREDERVEHLFGSEDGRAA